jgi:hypothetical protein
MLIFWSCRVAASSDTNCLWVSRNASSALLLSKLKPSCRAIVAAHHHKPLSMPKFAGELKALGYNKSKSCGVIRYRGLRFAA